MEEMEQLESLLTTIENGSVTRTDIESLNDFFRGNWSVGRVCMCLRKWRRESLPNNAYESLSEYLRGLEIFRIFDVPLFIDSYGHKRLLSCYEETVSIPIKDLLTEPIIHVTHREEAEEIAKDKKFQPSDAKNIIKGIWFNKKSDGIPSIFGRWAFETTLAALGVTGLRQGEVVSYKNQVNVILYASADGSDDVKVPTVAAACSRAQNPSKGYVMISIFVPSKFLPQQADEFERVFKKPHEVSHGPFCVRQKRSMGMIQKCDEQNYS